MYIADKVEDIIDLNSVNLNPLGVTIVVEVFKALYKGLSKLMHLTNIRFNNLLLGSKQV